MNTVKRFVAAALLTFFAFGSVIAGATMPIVPISAPIVMAPNYFSFTGMVQEINLVTWQTQSWQQVLVADAEGKLTNFVVNADTVFFTEAPLRVGATVQGFWDGNKPMIMIYPPQPTAIAMAVDLSEVQSVTVAHFDDDLLAHDQSLKLNMGPDTVVVDAQGQPFSESLHQRTLAVLYSFTTRSIPPQTSPIKVIVLPAEAPAVEQPGEGNAPTFNEIVVENKRIDAPQPFFNDDRVVMVPLRAIAEALGLSVTWHDATNSVTVGENIEVYIGKDSHHTQGRAVIALGSAPTIVNGRTFVPLQFFSEVLGLNNAYVFEGQVVVDNGEAMR